MIQVNNISKSFGDQVLLDSASFTMDKNEKLALVGRNGSGKSTLFKLLIDEMAPDGGNIIRPSNYQISCLRQHIDFTADTVRNEGALSLKEDQRYDTYLVDKILYGLGFTEEDLKKKPELLSSGQQMKLELGKVLLNSPDLVLLDEPTNYLDIVAIRWLKKFLKTFKGEVIIISHDKEFLDEVCHGIIGLKRRKFRKVRGKWEDYVKSFEEEDEYTDKLRVSQEKKAKELETFITKFKAKASKARQAGSKSKQLAKLDIPKVIEKEEDIFLKFHYHEVRAKTLLKVENLEFGFKENNPLFSNLSFSFEREDKIAIVGKNGKGKSTLINVLANKYKPTDGFFEFHDEAKIAHFGQQEIDKLHDGSTIFEELREINLSLSKTEIMAIAASMLFKGDVVEKKIKVLSGGERARLLFAKILAQKCNVLLLDEPTNHLDLESVLVLQKELKKFPGLIIFVSHNEYLLKHVANKLIYFKNGEAKFFWGKYREFLNTEGFEDDLLRPQKKENEKEKNKEKNKNEPRKIKENRDNEKNILSNNQQQKIEEEIYKLEELVQKYQDLMQDKLQNGEDITTISIQIGKLEEKIEEKIELLC